MLGAIYGDKAGSIYEFDQTKNIKSINTDKLIVPESFYSDDTIETIAITDAIINHKDYGDTLKKYIIDNEEYSPKFKDNNPYFRSPFSPHTMRWARGTARSDSIGNGAMMRISPVGYLFDSEDEVRENAYLATIPSHNSKEAIDSATIISLMIFYFRKGMSKEEVYNKLHLLVKYEPFEKFNMTCGDTINNCLFAIYNSNSFEEAIRNTLLMGGDTDTNCCIVGSIAESLFGMSNYEKNDALRGLPDNYVKILKKAYK